VQHLLGIGHLVRGARVARAAAAAGFAVTVVVGGEVPKGIDFGAVDVACLPPIKAGPGGFSDLVTPEGLPFDPARRTARRDELLRLFATIAPDVVLIEAFPFGRRAMRFELLPLLEAARARRRPPLVACSVRDILQQGKAPERDRETADIVRRLFDMVIVHGDPAFCRLDESFPLAAELDGTIVHTGLVGPEPDDDPPTSEAFDVIVSVGGGAVGRDLITAALAARPMCTLADASWLVLTGPNGVAMDPVPGVTLRAFAPDLPSRLRRARLSISQAGYNTVTDLFAAPTCRAILVPFAANGESEQTQRAAALVRRGWAVAVEAAGLTPAALAAAIDQVMGLPYRRDTPSVDGAARAAAHLFSAVERRRATWD
jgi:predicted glycosyltransferase